MAEYKTADKLPILEEVTETTYVLVEDSGSLKRVSGKNLGGKSNCCVINIDMTNMEVSAEGTSSDGIVYTCNMDYSELMEALQNRTLVSCSINLYSDPMMMSAQLMMIYFGYDAPGIMIEYQYEQGDELVYATLQFSADNTISEYLPS